MTYEYLLATVKRRKLKWYGHVTRSDGLTEVILQGTVEGSRRRGRPKKSWSDNIQEWTGKSFAETQAIAHHRQEWRELTRKSTMTRPLRLLTELRDQGKARPRPRHVAGENKHIIDLFRGACAVKGNVPVAGHVGKLKEYFSIYNVGPNCHRVASIIYKTDKSPYNFSRLSEFMFPKDSSVAQHQQIGRRQNQPNTLVSAASVRYNSRQYNTIQYNTIQYNTIQYNTIQYNAMQYNTIQCSAVQCSAVQCSAVQCSAVQCSAGQGSAVQCSAVQYSTVQYNTTSFISNIEHNNITPTICSQHWDGWKGGGQKNILIVVHPNIN